MLVYLKWIILVSFASKLLKRIYIQILIFIFSGQIQPEAITVAMYFPLETAAFWIFLSLTAIFHAELEYSRPLLQGPKTRLYVAKTIPALDEKCSKNNAENNNSSADDLKAVQKQNCEPRTFFFMFEHLNNQHYRI